jgi:hypothetical protein
MTAGRGAFRRIATLATTSAVVLLVAASCDAPTVPEDMTGLYVLERTREGPIPGAWVDLGDYSIREVAESLYLRPGRVGEQVIVYAFTIDSMPADTITVRDVWPFAYGIEGLSVTFRFRDSDDPYRTSGYRKDRYTRDAIISSNGSYVYDFRGRIPRS